MNSMPKSKNEYLYPIDPRNIARISYDESPAHIEKLKHAVDFICNEGTPVRAALDGTVVDVKQDSELGGENKSFDLVGNYIEIKHANGEYSICEHIQKNGSLRLTRQRNNLLFLFFKSRYHQEKNKYLAVLSRLQIFRKRHKC